MPFYSVREGAAFDNDKDYSVVKFDNESQARADAKRWREVKGQEAEVVEADERPDPEGVLG